MSAWRACQSVVRSANGFFEECFFFFFFFEDVDDNIWFLHIRSFAFGWPLLPGLSVLAPRARAAGYAIKHQACSSESRLPERGRARSDCKMSTSSASTSSSLAAMPVSAADSSTGNRGGAASPSSVSSPSQDAWIRSIELAQPEMRELARCAAF